MKASYYKHILEFKRPSGTSRGILKTKETWFIVITDDTGKKGLGECGILRTLSVDDRPDYEEKLKWTCENISLGKEKLYESLIEFPSIQFGMEQAFLSLISKTPFELFPSRFLESKDSIPINGLVWMGDRQFMKSQIIEKIDRGFSCIKLKIGAINFEEELELLKYIRSQFSSKLIGIRVDANGAFKPHEALEKLKRLSIFNLHSIEQPIAVNQHNDMADLCKNSPLPIALDEELIGVFSLSEKEKLLEAVKPQYIILKPSLVGGFSGTKNWIDLANKYQINWWITSALESNIGLNAISQFTYSLKSPLPQGLGTGELYNNNLSSPLVVVDGCLNYDKSLQWKVPYLS